MAVEDAATLGKLSAHLHTITQISTFLSAVQEIRAARVDSKHVFRMCEGNIFAIALPPGPGHGRTPTSEEMIQFASRGRQWRALCERALWIVE
ncbi:hypothetical protein C8Q80DRAFT_1273714 [Daedaleopsis nitida]|nr:hypothetical protein C8Q80DRAFT_1273714 [Daedaleopsis nitida]